MDWVVATFYKFTPLAQPACWQAALRERCQSLGLRGTVLLAAEGLNATVAGSRQGIDQLLAWLQGNPEIGVFSHQESTTPQPPFERMKVKLKGEIVSFGQPDGDPSQLRGTYIEPGDWNQLITDPEVVVIDSRNGFEVDLGTFKGAINPHTRAFGELPAYLNTHLSPTQHKKVAMFCTGGIRCEKATAYLLNQGFEQVYHLRGGILNYLNTVPEADSLWQGHCFVFDQRVAVDHHLQPGEYDLCGGCGYPVSTADRAAPQYQPGLSCPHCYPTSETRP
ncbi:MAG: rhodanese-related sulfurtransferase [Nodosilinea sp.]